MRMFLPFKTDIQKIEILYNFLLELNYQKEIYKN